MQFSKILKTKVRGRTPADQFQFLYLDNDNAFISFSDNTIRLMRTLFYSSSWAIGLCEDLIKHNKGESRYSTRSMVLIKIARFTDRIRSCAISNSDSKSNVLDRTPIVIPIRTYSSSWERPRLEATRKLGVFSVDTVCEKIMEDEGNWDCLSQFVRGILLEKRPDLDREVAQIP
ncbi:hypothetical protein J6590_082530 [Homalodisca vitripennis]|nr:hypothetical protein J6590_082530 [Homalodisca vitripennis]